VLRIDSHGSKTGSWTPLGVAGDTQFTADHLIISGAGVVVAPEHQMPIQVNNLDVLNGAVLTTRPTDATQEYSLMVTVANALTVDAASAIDVSGKGYMGGYTVGNTNFGGASVWAAGSYGGLGGGAPSPSYLYGDPNYPNELGSGGSNANHTNVSPGGPGAGGGLIHVTAATATIDGAIRADGNGEWNWDGHGGGGSGGAILFNVGTLAGSGVIEANGGASGWNGGGGGRVAIYNWSPGGVTLPTGNLTAKGGAGGQAAGTAGTVVLSQTPNYYWRTPEALFHGSQTLAWEALAVDPTSIVADITAYSRTSVYPIAVNRPPMGSLSWDTTSVPDGAYQIRVAFHDALGHEVGRITRSVGINNAAAWHSGSITSDEVWTSDRIHIVAGMVTIESGATLTIQPGAIVKFLPGTQLRLIVQAGGTLNALATPGSAIVLTSLSDDSAGGDSNYDGGLTAPQAGDWHGLLVASGGTENVSSYVQERYMLMTVACVQWQGGLSHETINGASTLLTAVVLNDQFPLTYTWDFGDGSTPVSGTANTQADAYNIEASHNYPDSGPGTPYVATLTVTDPSGNSSSSQYPIVVRGDSLNVERDIAIDRGLWWLHKIINRSGSLAYWIEGGYSISLTGSAVVAFENSGHLPTGDPTKDPYVADVTGGLNYLFSRMVVQPIAEDAQSPYGNPDTNGNGIGISVNSDRYTYEIGPAMMAIAASTTPEAIAQFGPANVYGRTYRDILTDMVDMCAWGQDEAGAGRGGWRYAWNYSDSDNSVTQWPILGIEAAEANWGIVPPDFVKRELELYLTSSQDASGCWGYAGADGQDNFSHAGAAIAGLSYLGNTPDDSRIAHGLAWMDANWNNAGIMGGSLWNNKYSMYAVAKGLRLANPAITTVGTHDWYAEFSRSLIATQSAAGNWPVTSPWTSGYVMDTAFSLLVLEPTVLSRPPVAVLTVTPLGAQPGQVFTFDASQSYHLDSTRKIVEYDFDFGDGTTYVETAANAPDGVFDGKTTHVYADTADQLQGMPSQRHDYTVTVTVRDDDPRGAKTDEAVQIVTISLVNHPPVADPGGPYVGYVGMPVTLSGIGSYDPDAGDPFYNHIASYGWQLTTSAPYQFNDAHSVATNWTWNTPGTYNVGLKVTDRFGASSIAWTTVEIRTGVPTNMFVRADLEGEYHTYIDLMAQLTTPTGTPVPGMPVDFYLDRNHDGSFDPVQEFVGEATTAADGWATLPWMGPAPADDYAIEAKFVGQSDYFASLGDGEVEVAPGRTVVLYTGDTMGLAGQTIALGAILTNIVGDPLANETISFNLAGQTATALTDLHGVATTSIVLAEAEGTLTAEAAFEGDSNYDVSSDSAPFATEHTSPLLAAIANQTLDEGKTLDVTPTFTDTDLGEVHTVTVDWGDGSAQQTLTLTHDERAFDLTHAFLEEGTYHASVTVSDLDGSDTKSFLVNVTDPAVVAKGGYAIAATEGVGFSSQTVGTFTDPGGAEPNAADPDPALSHHYTATIDWGDKSSSNGVITQSEGVFTVQGGHLYATEGTYPISVTIHHEAAADAQANSTALVSGHTPPVLAPVADQTLNEGGTLPVSASFTDQDVGQVHTAQIDWGDGSPAATFTLAHEERSFAGTHLYAEEGTYHASVTVTDEDGSDTKTFLVAVTDPAVVARGGYTIAAKEAVAFTTQTVATFTDPGGAEPNASDPDPVLTHHYTATIDWGDKSTSEGAITLSGGVFTVQGGHLYAAEGTYPISVTIHHEAAADAQANSMAHVSGHTPPVLGGFSDQVLPERGALAVMASFIDQSSARFTQRRSTGATARRRRASRWPMRSGRSPGRTFMARKGRTTPPSRSPMRTAATPRPFWSR
jgi:PKD repeat protein